MSTSKKIPIEKATSISRRFLKLIQPHVLKCEVAGSLRRQCKEIGDIDIVCVEDLKNSLSNVFHKNFKGMTTNGPRLKRFKYPEENVQIELHIAQPFDYGRILAIKTGSSAFSHIKLAITWNRKGWCGTVDGLRRKSQCTKKGNKWYIRPEFKENPTLPPVFNNEVDFFTFLELPWIPPEERNWQSKYDKYNYAT